jgi:hypothetical protein
MEFDDKETCTTLYTCLSSLKLEAHTILEEKGTLHIYVYMYIYMYLHMYM